MVTNQTSSFLVGTDDPVFGIWLSSMQVLTGLIRTSSLDLLEADNRVFDNAVEFLQIYRGPLLACLQGCGSKLTRNSLKETKILLSLVAELCKRRNQEHFVQSTGNLFEELIQYAKIVVSYLSKFLGATGTSQELFTAIYQYESSDPDRFEDHTTMTPFNHRPSLLSDGLASSKHEAIKYSHFASGISGRMTKEDFERSAIVPDFLKHLSQGQRDYETDLERNCRLSVSSNFSLDLIGATAQALSEALALIWRTHSVNSSFYAFNGSDSLVVNGIVVGYRPHVGQNLLTEYGGSTTNFDLLRFGRVIKSDTFSRTWEVEVIREEGPEQTVHHLLESKPVETVQASQIVGIEDESARRSASSLSPAPDSMSSFERMATQLTTGNYILILNWCHQQVTIAPEGSPLDSGFKVPEFVQQLAEEATILLGADLVIHELNGQFKKLPKKDVSRLDEQISDLFADTSLLINSENDEPLSTTAAFPDGKMKDIIGPTVWNGVQSQVRPFVLRSMKDKQDLERKRKEKRLFSNSGSTFFSSSSKKGAFQHTD